MANSSLQKAESWSDPFGEPGDESLQDFDFAPIENILTDAGYGVVDLTPPPKDRFRADAPDKTYDHQYPNNQPLIPLGAQPWSASLIFDLALGLESTHDVLKHHGVPIDVYEQYLAIPAFRRELSDTIRLNREKGIGFERKAAFMAEDCLPDMYNIAKDKSVGAAVRASIFRDLTRLGNLEPKNKEGANEKGGAPQVNIQINL